MRHTVSIPIKSLLNFKHSKGKVNTMAKTLNLITEERLAKYFAITTEAFEEAQKSSNRRPELDEQRIDYLDMIKRYIDDAGFFRDEKNDYVNAFAALSYAHGWLDAGARLGLFDVHDSRLFTVDDE